MLPPQKKLAPSTYRSQDPVTKEWSEEKTLNVDPKVYTSVHDWKPVQPERFLFLMHAYHMLEEASDEWGHGKIRGDTYHLSGGVTSIIYYVPKDPGSPVSSPVLMSLSYESGKVICFASLTYGMEAEKPQPAGFTVYHDTVRSGGGRGRDKDEYDEHFGRGGHGGPGAGTPGGPGR